MLNILLLVLLEVYPLLICAPYAHYCPLMTADPAVPTALPVLLLFRLNLLKPPAAPYADAC